MIPVHAIKGTREEWERALAAINNQSTESIGKLRITFSIERSLILEFSSLSFIFRTSAIADLINDISQSIADLKPEEFYILTIQK